MNSALIATVLVLIAWGYGVALVAAWGAWYALGRLGARRVGAVAGAVLVAVVLGGGWTWATLVA